MMKAKIKNIRKALAALSVMVIPVFGCYQNAFAETSSSKITITAANLNVREDADLSSKIISMVHQGDTFEILQTKDSWDQIKLLSNQTGWISNMYTKRTGMKEATVEAPVLNVRQEPGVSSPIVGKLPIGTKVFVQDEKAGWDKIMTASGAEGWVCEYYIKKEASTVAIQKESKSVSSPITAQSIKTESIPNSQGPLNGKTIVLDPGHGGIDIGTTSITGTHEKTLTLATAQAVEQKLEDAGANVIMTRTDDTYIPLEQRAGFSNQSHADAFISFHYNWSNDPSVNGLTDFYYQQSRDNTLASDILNEVVNTTKLANVGTRFDNLSVLRNNSQPSTLIELGFLSNKQDDSVVESDAYRDNVAEGIYMGLLKYWSLPNTETKEDTNLVEN